MMNECNAVYRTANGKVSLVCVCRLPDDARWMAPILQANDPEGTAYTYTNDEGYTPEQVAAEISAIQTEYAALLLTVEWNGYRYIVTHLHTITTECRTLAEVRQYAAQLRRHWAEAEAAEAPFLALPSPPFRWQSLRLINCDNQPIADSARIHAALAEYRASGEMSGVFFTQMDLPHEDPNDASTWGPVAPTDVDWTGFTVEGV